MLLSKSENLFKNISVKTPSGPEKQDSRLLVVAKYGPDESKKATGKIWPLSINHIPLYQPYADL
jgi:hypothetical protein